MSLLARIVYAAHANGTHHKLALDALARLQGTDAERWQNLFLQHAKVYLEGSRVPDTQFKDFKNHVLHVRDDYWGGAPEKAQEWYGKLLDALRAEVWSEAAYSAGVLSHYYTDPIQPFHTAQTEPKTRFTAPANGASTAPTTISPSSGARGLRTLRWRRRGASIG